MTKEITAEHQQALKWAREQNFGSVAARYAKLCAEAYDIIRSETQEAFNLRVRAAVRAANTSEPLPAQPFATPGATLDGEDSVINSESSRPRELHCIGYSPTLSGYGVREGSPEGELIATFKRQVDAEAYCRKKSIEQPGYHCGKLKAECDDEYCPTHGRDIR
jgi:hypothetical protein